jgi:hypothetical protein
MVGIDKCTGVKSLSRYSQRTFPSPCIADLRHPSGDGFGSISTQATFSPKSPISPAKMAELLRIAWKGARYGLHPLLAAVSHAPDDIYDVNGYSLTYPLVTEESANIWARETVIQHEAIASMEKLSESLENNSPTARGSRGQLHFAPSSINDAYHVVLVCGHWITDGRGGLKILNRILEGLNDSSVREYDWGSEVARLSVPLAVATGHRTAHEGVIEPLPKAQVDKFLEAFMEGQVAEQPIFSRPQGTHTLPQRSRNINEKISLDSTALIQACRAHGVTVTALLNVVFCMAFIGEKSLEGCKTVAIPLFSVHRGEDLIGIHSESVGLEMILAPLGLDAKLIAGCMGSTDAEAIWTASMIFRQQLVQAKVNQYNGHANDRRTPQV